MSAMAQIDKTLNDPEWTEWMQITEVRYMRKFREESAELGDRVANCLLNENAWGIGDFIDFGLMSRVVGHGV